MYHRFHVDEFDRDFLRFLWWKDGNINQPVCEFCMKVHLFGAASSSGCANYGLKHLATENSELYPLGSQFVLKYFYVDDGVISVEDADQAIKVANEAQKLCAIGGSRLHKFVSNSETMLESIPASERTPDVKNLDLAFDELHLERTLGMQWERESDCFKFKVQLKDQPASRHGILSTVASVYDPLGLLAPVLLSGKRILQEVCKRGSGWDDPLSDGLRWERWKRDLNDLVKIDIPHTYAPSNFGKPVKAELHHFSDACTYGYGQCSYIRLKNEEGDIYCAIVMAKSRVSPLKLITVPRLELAVAVVSVEMSSVLKKEMDYTVVEETFWTDSKVVLGYISNEARRFHTFVANRVQRIRNGTTTEQWRYVPTEENPADHASRGLTVKELLASNWFAGPKFLWEKEMPVLAKPNAELLFGDPAAIRAVARLLRRVNKDKSGHLSTVSERQKAELHIIKCLQESFYKDELREIKGGSKVSSHSALYPLDSFLDEDCVLRVGGRLGRSSCLVGV
ncbi:putative oxidoreductase virH [Labeo rohita]|uniref:Oxidoreductase virH n=1 Tax=Labeo rohita TaxID=84645 RepID=A0ABQ8L1U5_LABRO|nr:putative oxidoreductase virH [Labeo rohita]